jgi:Transglutaminase-like superfamily
MSAISKLAKLRRLTNSERRLLLRALAMLPLIALALRVAGLRRVQAFLARLSPLSGRARDDHVASMHAKHVARLVSVAATHGPYRAKCLPTALALQSILRRRGIQADLRLGVRKDSGRIEAHAWLEHRGIALIDSADVHKRYSAFAEAISHETAKAR